MNYLLNKYYQLLFINIYVFLSMKHTNVFLSMKHINTFMAQRKSSKWWGGVVSFYHLTITTLTKLG